MLKKIFKLSTVLTTSLIINLNAEEVYAPAVTVTGGQQESESLSGSGVFIGSDVIQENNYDNIYVHFYIN